MRQIVLFGLGLFLFVGLLFLLNIDWIILTKIQQPIFLLFSLIAFLLAIMVLSLRVRFFLKALKEKHIFFRKLIEIEFANKFFYYILPGRINVPAKAVLLHKVCGTSKGHAISITAFEYALDVSILVSLGLIGISLFFQKLSWISLDRIILSLIGLIAIVLIFFTVPLNTFITLSKKVERIKSKLIRKALELTIKLLWKIREIWPKILLNKQMIWAIPLIVFNWLLTISSIELIFLAYGQFVPILWILTVGAVSILVGGASQIPGGMGAKDATSILLFVFLGVPKEVAASAAIISRLFTIVPIFLGYLFLIKTKVDLKNLI